MFIDPTYIIFVLPALIFTLWASAHVKKVYAQHQTQYSQRGLTGAQAAETVLHRGGVYNVRIEMIGGNLSDHYDPKENVIRLSQEVYSGTSTASIGVAAHEAGHALQYAGDYLPIRVRAAIIPVTSIGSKLAMPLILIGLLFSAYGQQFGDIAMLGVMCYGLCTLFQLLTLPVEFNASSRAIEAIEAEGILTNEETKGAGKVLRAAALTYVAALAASLAQFLRLFILVSGRTNRRR